MKSFTLQKKIEFINLKMVIEVSTDVLLQEKWFSVQLMVLLLLIQQEG